MISKTQRKHNIIVIIAAIFALSYIGFLFLPYFRVYNAQTKQLSYSLTGITLSLGKSSSGAIVKGSTLLLVGQIIGSCGGLLTLAFSLLYIFKKKHNSIMYFILGISVFCIAFALASILLSGPVYSSNNEIKNKTLLYSPYYYLTLVITILSFLLNLFIIFYVSFSDLRSKRVPQIEK